MKQYITSKSLKFAAGYVLLTAIGALIPSQEEMTYLVAASLVNIVIMLLPIYAIIDTHLEINARNRYYLSFKEAFLSGSIIAVFVGLVTAIKAMVANVIADYHNIFFEVFTIAGATFLVYLSALLLIIIFEGQWKIFSKAGKKGWASIVPVYNIVVMLEIVGKPSYWIIFFLIPGVNIIFSVWITNLLSKSYGKEVDFTLGMVFLPFIFYPLLGLSRAEYEPEFINA